MVEEELTAHGCPAFASGKHQAPGPPGSTSVVICLLDGCMMPASVAHSSAVMVHGPLVGPSLTVPRSSP